MSERKCPHNGAVLQPDAKRGLWRCDQLACYERYKVSGVDCVPYLNDDEYTAPMTAAEQMEALGQEKLL